MIYCIFRFDGLKAIEKIFSNLGEKNVGKKNTLDKGLVGREGAERRIESSSLEITF